jgi:hypothetical protein
MAPKELNIKSITHPFPSRVPASFTISVVRPDGPLGCSFAGTEPGTVHITAIQSFSVLNSTPIRVGHILLAVDGVQVQSRQHAAQLIKSVSPGFELQLTAGDRTPALYKLVPAKFSKSHPSIVFDSTRHRTMVQVSRIFPNTAFSSTTLEVGDLVMAVNGVPVSRPEDADRLYRQSMGVAVLYVLDMSAVQDDILSKLAAAKPNNLKNAKLKRLSDIEFQFSCARYHAKTLELDSQTHQFVDPVPFRHLWYNQGGGNDLIAWPRQVYMEAAYVATVQVFMTTYNAIIDHQLKSLEDVVCKAAWKRAMEEEEGDHNIVVLPVEATAPYEDSNGGANDDAYLPVATVIDIEVDDEED